MYIAYDVLSCIPLQAGKPYQQSQVSTPYTNVMALGKAWADASPIALTL